MDPEQDPEGRNVRGDRVVSGKPLETDHNLNFPRLCSLGLKIRKETLQFSAKEQGEGKNPNQGSGCLQEKQCLSRRKAGTEGSQKYRSWDVPGHRAVLLGLSKEGSFAPALSEPGHAQ